MSIKIGTPLAALSESFMGATAELTLENKFKSERISAPRDVVRSIASSMVAAKIDYVSSVKPHLSTFSSSTGAPSITVSESRVRKTIEAAEERFKAWLEKFEGELNRADDKLRMLATEIKEKAEELGVGVEEYLRRMQSHLYGWVLANAAVPSFAVGTGKTRVAFAPDKVTSSGKFEFGPIGSSIASVDDIIGVLKIIPTISLEVDVEYTTKTASTKASKTR